MESGLELLLLRHAKSAWDDAGLNDIDRPLAPRGEKAAKAMGRFMADQNLVPDLVLCSPARRARQTWERVAASLPATVTSKIVNALYDFGDGAALLDAIRAEGGRARRLMLVGHNPSMEGLARQLAKAGEPELLRRMAEKYPTAGLAVLRFAAQDWRHLAGHDGMLSRFVRPRDLG